MLEQIKPKSSESKQNFFLTQGGCVSCLHGCFQSLISTQTFWTTLTAVVDSCVDIKSTPTVT